MNLEKTKPRNLQRMLERRVRETEQILAEAKRRGYLIRRESVHEQSEFPRHVTTIVTPRDAFLPITRFFIYEKLSDDESYSQITSEGNSGHGIPDQRALSLVPTPVEERTQL